jgi:hypothetical protein
MVIWPFSIDHRFGEQNQFNPEPHWSSFVFNKFLADIRISSLMVG